MTEPNPAPAPAVTPAPGRLSRLAHKLAAALLSKEARGPELALARIILAALGVKLGINFADYVK